jgi:GT2 family glycosyltransferase
MQNARSISVIVVNYNGYPFLYRLFESLSRQTVPPDEIIMVDNASTDGSVDLVRTRFPAVRIIEAGANVGFAVGNNIGVVASHGEFIALINSDAYVEPEWCESLIAVLENDSGTAVSVGKIYRAGSNRIVEQAGGLFNNVGNYWGRGYMEQDVGQYDAPCEVAGVTACAMMIRRDAIPGTELFDPDLFMYGEELDLTIRLRASGYTIRYTPDAVAWHTGMGSLELTQTDKRLFQQFHANRNRLKVIARRYPRIVLLRSLPAICLGLIYWNAFFLIHGGPSLLLRALKTQFTAIRHGLAQHSPEEKQTVSLWLPWMTRHSLRAMLAAKRATHRY